jgi:hypothetical protein
MAPIAWLNAAPFKHILLDDVLAEDVCRNAVVFLETIHWMETRDPLFAFHVNVSCDDPERLWNLVPRSIIEASIRTELACGLEIELTKPVRLGLQKYVDGSGIGPHTDSDLKVARFILNLNRGWTLNQGGIWLLSDNDQFLPAPMFVAPKNNAGFGFVPARNTYHALSERVASESYALIFEFPLS